jgi:hypothetical protein
MTTTTLRPDHYEDTAADRDDHAATYAPGETVGDRDTGYIYLRTTEGWKPISIGGAVLAHIAGSDLPLESSIHATEFFTIPAADVTERILHFPDAYDYARLNLGTFGSADTLDMSVSMDDNVTYKNLKLFLTDADILLVGAVSQFTAAGSWLIDFRGVTDLKYKKTGTAGTLVVGFKAGI